MIQMQKKVKEKDMKIEVLKKQLVEMQEQLEALKGQLEAMKKMKSRVVYACLVLFVVFLGFFFFC